MARKRLEPVYLAPFAIVVMCKRTFQPLRTVRRNLPFKAHAVMQAEQLAKARRWWVHVVDDKGQIVCTFNQPARVGARKQ